MGKFLRVFREFFCNRYDDSMIINSLKAMDYKEIDNLSLVDVYKGLCNHYYFKDLNRIENEREKKRVIKGLNDRITFFDLRTSDFNYVLDRLPLSQVGLDRNAGIEMDLGVFSYSVFLILLRNYSINVKITDRYQPSLYIATRSGMERVTKNIYIKELKELISENKERIRFIN